MRGTLPLPLRHVSPRVQNLIQIHHGTFYRQHPGVEGRDSVSNPPLFPDLSFELPAATSEQAGTRRLTPHWAVISPSTATPLLEILRGSYICIPPKARSFPYLSSEEVDQKAHRLRVPSRAIQYVGFNAGKGSGPNSGVRGAYLSARYESRREETDWSLMQYLTGETDLNPADDQKDGHFDKTLLRQVIQDLKLEKLVTMPVSNLSNGQTRRARIARALLGKPELLLLDEPFMGLDPPTLVRLSPILRDLAYRSSPLLLLALRPQDPIPDWITHLMILGSNNTIALSGPITQVLFSLHRWVDAQNADAGSLVAEMAKKMTDAFGPPPLEVGHALTERGVVSYDAYELAKSSSGNKYFTQQGSIALDALPSDLREAVESALALPAADGSMTDYMTITSAVPTDFENSFGELNPRRLEGFGRDGQLTVADNISATTPRQLGEPLIELSSIVIKYGDKTVLGHLPAQTGFSEPGLHLTIRQGTRLALLGPNGSGKTTLLSLLTSDHPHSYSLPIKFFGRTRLPLPGKPGLSLWEIQSRIGHSSPEVHAFFPKNLSVRKVLESAWAETFGAKPKLTYDRDQKVDAVLRWWEPELRQFGVTVHALEATPAALSEYEKTRMLTMKWPILRCVRQSYPPLIGEGAIPLQRDEPEDALSWAEDQRDHAFGVLPFAAQRLLLLLRTVIKDPDIVVLDEAFSGLSSEVREKAMCWLEHGEAMFLQKRQVSNQHSGSVAFEPGSRMFLGRLRVRMGPGKPRMSALLRRPDSVPGRPRGRPTGGKNVRGGRIDWKPAAIRKALRAGGNETLLSPTRWEVFKVPNRRSIAEAVFRAHDRVQLPELIKRSTIRYKHPTIFDRQSQAELDETAHDTWSAHSADLADRQGYTFTGLSNKQALVVVSHVREEIPPNVDEWLRLPGEEEVTEEGRGVEMGRCDGGSIRTAEGWNRVWGL